MSDMLPLNRNWYIQRDLCLVHSELATAIEASVVHSHKAVVPQGSESCRLSTHPRLNSQLGKVFLWVTPPEKRESTAKWFFSRMLSNFRQLFLRKFPRYPAVNHSFFRASGLERLVSANIRCLDKLGGAFWHNYSLDFFSDCNV